MRMLGRGYDRRRTNLSATPDSLRHTLRAGRQYRYDRSRAWSKAGRKHWPEHRRRESRRGGDPDRCRERGEVTAGWLLDAARDQYYARDQSAPIQVSAV